MIPYEINHETSYFVAGVLYDDTGFIAFPGGHDEFRSAARKARILAAALKQAGETGLRPYVHYRGERPKNFPRNGVPVSP